MDWIRKIHFRIQGTITGRMKRNQISHAEQVIKCTLKGWPYGNSLAFNESSFLHFLGAVIPTAGAEVSDRI